MEELLWGIDMGGTKIEGVVLKKDPSLDIIERIRIPTEQEGGYEHILSQFQKLVAELKKSTGQIPRTIGIGTPGIIDGKTQVIKNSNTLCIVGKPIQKDLKELLSCNIKMANDANCFAMAEASLGIVTDHLENPEVVFGVILGTGVGGGVVVNGKVIHGLHGIAGEWGHNCLDPNGTLCYCGQKGCVETFLSGPANEKYYADISGVQLSLKEIYTLYLNDDLLAKQTMDRYMHYFGKALAVVVNIIDPAAIVFGGGVGKLDIIYERGRAEIEKHLFNDQFNSLLLKPKLGDSAGVIGAALL